MTAENFSENSSPQASGVNASEMELPGCRLMRRAGRKPAPAMTYIRCADIWEVRGWFSLRLRRAGKPYVLYGAVLFRRLNAETVVAKCFFSEVTGLCVLFLASVSSLSLLLKENFDAGTVYRGVITKGGSLNCSVT